ncbi:MAG: hypothetical protein OXB90_04970 [Acidimicrobiaceae bacterium]|nr:hypothetical protein [Acidimicrobiaceae bacterium]
MAARIHSTSFPRSDMTPRRRMRAADVVVVIALGSRRELLGFSMFAKEWEWWPVDRDLMVADRPVTDNLDDLCRIAAVVHALCGRDGVVVPEWVFDYTSPRPLTLGPSLVIDGQIWHQAVSEAPPACEYHNVWFDYRTIETLKAAAKRIKASREAEQNQ